MSVQNSRKSGLNWSGGKPGAREVYLGVFGKHPGWDDHIDDIGLETDRLVAVKRMLYSEGIGGNIDSGAWEKLDEAQRLSSFGHEFVWRLGGDVIVGRIWASRDGKGRTRYPMGVAAQCVNVPAPVIEAEIMARLEEAERRFVATTSASEVRQITDEVRKQLREALSQAPTTDTYGDVAPPSELATMADLPQLGEGRVGLYRVLYEMERELGAFRPAGKTDSRKTTKFVDTRAQHLRVPACASSSFAAARQWFGVLTTQIDPTASMLAFRPHGKGFVDLIVGEPASQQLFCVKASEKGLAPASEVPYTLDAELVNKWAAMVDGWRSGQAAPSTAAHSEPDPAPVPVPQVVVGEPTRKKSGWFKWGGIGTVLVLAAGGAYLATRPPPNGTPPPTGLGEVALSTKPSTDPNPANPSSSQKGSQQPGTTSIAKAPDADLKAKQPEVVSDTKQAADAQAAKKLADDQAEKKRTDDAAALAKQREADAAKQRLADAAAEQKRAADEADRKRLAGAEAEKKRTADTEAAKKETLVRAASELGALLAVGYGLDDNPGGGTVRARGAALTGDPLFASVRDSTPEFAALAARLATLEKIASSTDAPFLSTQAGGAQLSEGAAAWSRLAAGAVAGWPASSTDLNAAGKSLEALRKAAGALSEKSHAEELVRRLNTDGKKVWSAYFRRATPGDPQGISAACSLMSAFGVSADELPPRARFNVLLNSLRRDAAAMGPIKPGDSAAMTKAQERIGSFVKEASVLGLDADGAAAVAVVEALARTLAAPAGFEAAKAGPGLRGWKGQIRDTGGTASVIYVWPPEGTLRHTLEFLRVDTPGGAAFIGTTEVTLGLVIDAVEESGKWTEFLTLLPGLANGNDNRLGPRAWNWTAAGKAIVPSEPAPDFPLAGWLPPTNQMKGVQYYAAELPSPPSLQSPMQLISAPGAIFAARLLGCRLPTTAEWQAAAARPTKSQSPPNRRDATWVRTQAYLAAKPKPPSTWPDDGIFLPKELKGVARRGSAAAAVETDDGLIWFADQPSGGDSEFKNLIGSVAEFVLVQPGTGDLRGLIAPEEARASVGTKGEGVRIIGASALSPSEVDAQTPYAMDIGADKVAFSDVGFRLAFPATGAAPAAPPDLAAAVGAIKFLSLKE